MVTGRTSDAEITYAVCSTTKKGIQVDQGYDGGETDEVDGDEGFSS